VRPVWVTGLARLGLGLGLGLRQSTKDTHPDPYDGQSATSISPQGWSPSLVSLCGNTVNQPRARESPCAQGKWRTVAYQADTYSTSTTPRPLSFGSSTRGHLVHYLRWGTAVWAVVVPSQLYVQNYCICNSACMRIAH